MYETLAILAAFVFLYSTVGGSLERTPINGALVFTAFGLVFGPLGLDLLDLIETAPFLWWHYRRYGVRALAAQGRIDEAIDYANRAIRIEDREYRFYYTLAQLQYRTGHESRARLNLRKAIRLAPEWGLDV